MTSNTCNTLHAFQPSYLFFPKKNFFELIDAGTKGENGNGENSPLTGRIRLFPFRIATITAVYYLLKIPTVRQTFVKCLSSAIKTFEKLIYRISFLFLSTPFSPSLSLSGVLLPFCSPSPLEEEETFVNKKRRRKAW